MRLALLGLALLAGCQSTPEIRTEVVEVTVREYVPVPEELTAPCQTHPAREQTVGEAIRVANARLASLAECNSRLRAIRDLGPLDEPADR